MKKWLFSFLVLFLVSLFALSSSPLPAEDPGQMSNEQILLELDRHEAFMAGALSAIAADKEDRETLRSEVRYLIDLEVTQNRSVYDLIFWLKNSGVEQLPAIITEVKKWRWREFWIGAGSGVAVIVIGRLIASRF